VKRTSIKKIYLMLIGLFFTLQSGFAFAAGQTIENPVIGEKGYHVGSYGNGAYWITNGLYNSMFIVSDEGVIVVDAPPSYADKIPAAIKEVTDLPVKYFVYSHHHNDHTGGSAVFGNEVIRVGHELTAQELRRKADPTRPVPTVTFSDTYTLELGNQRVELAYPGLQHSPGNIFVYLPTQKVLMMVDVLIRVRCHSITSQSPPAFLVSMTRLIKQMSTILNSSKAVMWEGLETGKISLISMDI